MSKLSRKIKVTNKPTSSVSILLKVLIRGPEARQAQHHAPCAIVLASLTAIWTLYIGATAASRLWIRSNDDRFVVAPGRQGPLADEHILQQAPAQSLTNVLKKPPVSVVSVPAASPAKDEQLPRHTHVFYNIFIPDDRSKKGTGTQRAYNIVSEQLLQLAQSYVGGYLGQAAYVANSTSVTVHYTTIGPSDLLTETEMNDPSKFCGMYPNIHCRHLGHFTEGSEAYTLEQLRQHCVGHPSERVVYLHSKGSFHPRELNEGWRKALTFAATTKECVDPPDDSCSVCGILFYTQFTTFVPGNMFAAKCEYVSKLLSPLDEYPKKQREAIGDALVLRARRQLTSHFLHDAVDYFGLDRYSAEHWIGTQLLFPQ
jgi:hypothetical protein